MPYVRHADTVTLSRLAAQRSQRRSRETRSQPLMTRSGFITS